jgi:hypothetical protein
MFRDQYGGVDSSHEMQTSENEPRPQAILSDYRRRTEASLDAETRRDHLAERSCNISHHIALQSGREDLNLRPPAPEV